MFLRVPESVVQLRCVIWERNCKTLTILRHGERVSWGRKAKQLCFAFTPSFQDWDSRTAQLPSEMSPFASVPALLVPAVAWLGSEGSPEPTQDAETGGQAVCLLANKC